MNFGKNLRYLRRKQGYSQEDIAEKLGYKSYTTIQKWESGNSEPQVKVLNKVADIFNVSMNDLVAGDLENEEMSFALAQEETAGQILLGEYKGLLEMYSGCSEESQKRILSFIKNIYEAEKAEKELSPIPAEYLNEEEMLKKYGPAIPHRIASHIG